MVGFIVVMAVEAAHHWDPEERGCTLSAIFVIFGLWVVVRRSHPRAVFAGEQFLPPLAWAGGPFFPVVVLCQFLVLAGNRFWFYILM